MSAHTLHHVHAFFPNWSADALAAAMPHALPSLHTFDFRPSANAATLHHPRRTTQAYVPQAALTLFRVRG